MPSFFQTKASKDTCPITLLTTKSLKTWLKKQDKATKAWIKNNGFEANEGETLQVSGKSGQLKQILFGVPAELSLYSTASLPEKLKKIPGKSFRIEGTLTKKNANLIALGWALGCYGFDHYKKKKSDAPPKLVWPNNVDRRAVSRAAEGTFLARDLINAPPNDLGPPELVREARKVARRFGATCTVISGKALLGKNYPAIYEVGKGSNKAPCLIDIKWGSTRWPKVTIVGKGITFDTGGYNIKSGAGMLLMKKDMGGSALALGLAHMIMAAKLKVRLRVLIAAAENSIDANSYRPSDVINTRKGLTVEVDNTDAEGRLVICDALAEACREKPKFLVDFATLTGAARAATGPDMNAMFSTDDKLGDTLEKISFETEDPLIKFPLWQPYDSSLKSDIADTANSGTMGRAGHITAALFLRKFIDDDVPWIHIDTNAWNSSGRPGRPKGGEAMGMRPVYELIEKKFG